MTGRVFHILGVPLRTGSLMPGTESDAPAYRAAGLTERLQAAGHAAIDEGDLAVPSYLPHHTVPPIRNWPGPRIVWDLLADRLDPILRQPGHVPLLIGCDCSVVVGTSQALRRVSEPVHVLYIDGDFDDAAPDPNACQSAAAMALWLTTHSSPFLSGTPLESSQVTVLGWTKPSQASDTPASSVSLAEVRRLGASSAIRQVLAGFPSSAAILVHLDIDVFADSELPAAYFPHTDGLTLAQGAELFGPLLSDDRVRLVEISEYSKLRDMNHVWIQKLVGLLAGS